MQLSELLNHLASCGSRFRLHTNKALLDNEHLHTYRGEPIPQEAIDAILALYLSFIGASWKVPFDLSAEDLREYGNSPIVPLQINAPSMEDESEEEPDTESKIIIP